MLIKVEDNITLVRDSNTNAILNTDLQALNEYRSRRVVVDNKTKMINDLINRVEILEKIIKEKLGI